MLALVYHDPGELRLEQRPQPTPGTGDALIRVRACGICGTDLKIARGEHRLFPPGTMRIPGHELVGEIAELNSQEAGLAVGDLVVVAPNTSCGECVACRAGRANLCHDYQAVGITFDGGFAEYVRLPPRAIEQGTLLKLPPGTDPIALTLVEPLAAVLRGQRATPAHPGDVVVVCGAGPIGLLHVMVARMRSAGQVLVSEPAAARREQALAFGADAAVEPAGLRDAVLDASDGRGADVVIVAVPVPAVFEQSLDLAALGGRVNFFAGLPSGGGRLEVDANLIHYRELVVTGTTANTTEDCREALEAVLAGTVDASGLVSARYPLANAVDAFAAAASGDAMKIVVEA